MTTTALRVGGYRLEAAPTDAGPWVMVASGNVTHPQKVELEAPRTAAFYRLVQ